MSDKSDKSEKRAEKRVYVENAEAIEFTYGGDRYTLAAGKHLVGDTTVLRADGTEVLMDSVVAAFIMSKFGSHLAEPKAKTFVEYPDDKPAEKAEAEPKKAEPKDGATVDDVLKATREGKKK
jgi:hypothetical protein